MKSLDELTITGPREDRGVENTIDSDAGPQLVDDEPPGARPAVK